MPEGGTLPLRTRLVDPPVPDAQRRVLIEVVDTGVGMDEPTRRHAWSRSSPRKASAAAGSASQWCTAWSQRHSAELEIDSVIDKGTTFRMIFSSAAPDAIPAVHASSACRARRAPAHSARRRRSGAHQVARRHPEQRWPSRSRWPAEDSPGVDLFAAALGGAEPFSVVITDLGMPHVDGRRVASAVKARAPATPVILPTGWGHRLLAENDIPPHVDQVLRQGRLA